MGVVGVPARSRRTPRARMAATSWSPCSGVIVAGPFSKVDMPGFLKSIAHSRLRFATSPPSGRTTCALYLLNTRRESEMTSGRAPPALVCPSQPIFKSTSEAGPEHLVPFQVDQFRANRPQRRDRSLGTTPERNAPQGRTGQPDVIPSTSRAYKTRNPRTGNGTSCLTHC